MTQARLRECHSCNKMTCRCAALMCYICRAKIDPKVGYKHFCQHPRDPGKKCSKCTKCSLFTNSEQDDEMAIEEVRKQEQARLAEKEGEDSLQRAIGPPPESPLAKKQKIGPPAHPGVVHFPPIPIYGHPHVFPPIPMVDPAHAFPPILNVAPPQPGFRPAPPRRRRGGRR